MLADVQEPGVLHKFHASRPLQEDMAGDNKEVCFTIQAALRGPKAERLFSHLQQLCDCMALRLLKSRLRQERRQSTGLAKVVEDLLRRQLLDCSFATQATPATLMLLYI